MVRIMEKNVAEIIMIALFLVVVLSSCGDTSNYESLVVECENCDEVD